MSGDLIMDLPISPPEALRGLSCCSHIPAGGTSHRCDKPAANIAVSLFPGDLCAYCDDCAKFHVKNNGARLVAVTSPETRMHLMRWEYDLRADDYIEAGVKR